MPPTIAFQGVAGSFSHLAAEKHFGRDNNWMGSTRFREIFQAVQEGAADFGVIPIENSLAGSIYENYDLLAQRQVHITAEVYLRVEHTLAACPGADIARLRKVYSHPKALEQCQSFFDAHPEIEQSAFSDTAGAAQHVGQLGDQTVGAICSAEAARMYGLATIKRNIEDNASNITRFFVIARSPQFNPRADKCSIIFTTAHRPGSLFHALEVLAKGQTNLTKLESRPIHGKPFEYNFYVDFEFPAGDIQNCELLLGRFREHTLDLKVLGYFLAAAPK